MRLISAPVKRSRIYEDTLQKIGGKGGTLFPTLREALTFCAILGYKERRKVPLSSSAGTEDIAGAQYHNNEAVDALFALALADQGSSDILRPDREKECIEIYEQYANGGLQLVQSWLETYANLDVEQAIWNGLKTIGVKAPDDDDAPSEVSMPTF